MPAARPPEWKRLLEGECASSPELRRYATDPREGDCLRLLPRMRSGRALFFGNALAILPTILAEQFESVVVADSDDHRLMVAAERRDTENLTCVRITGAEEVAARLGQFDLLVLGEERPDAGAWLPFSNSDVPRELARAIVGGGWLMYGVRFPRLHALTRAVASVSARHAPMLYPAHARLLEAAGFTDVRSYGRWPQSRPYQFYIPLDDPAAVAYWLGKTQPPPIRLRRRVGDAAKAILRRLGASQYLFNNFLVIARRGQ